MSFSIFQFAFAAGGIGLLVVLVLVVRHVRQGRAAKSSLQPLQPAHKDVSRRGIGKARQAAEPEPPPPPRRRQLRPLSEVEQGEAPPAEAPIQMAETAVVEPAIAEDSAEEPPPVEETADEGDYAKVVLTRLEGCFERLQAGELTLDAYTAELVAEQADVDRRIAALRAGGASEELEQALNAAESVRWCLDWAAEQGRDEG